MSSTLGGHRPLWRHGERSRQHIWKADPAAETKDTVFLMTTGRSSWASAPSCCLTTTTNTTADSVTSQGANCWSRRLTEEQWEHTCFKLAVYIKVPHWTRMTRSEEAPAARTAGVSTLGSVATVTSWCSVKEVPCAATGSATASNKSDFCQQEVLEVSCATRRAFSPKPIWLYGPLHSLKPTVLRVGVTLSN